VGRGGEKVSVSRLDLRGHLLQPDDAGERADFLLLILTQLKQQRHRRRFQLLDFLGIGIDRYAGRFRVGLAGCVNFAGDGAQRGFHRRPVGFLRGGQFEAILDAGNLNVAEQSVGLLHGRLGGDLGLRRRSATKLSAK